MKKLMAILMGSMLATGVALAQGGPGGGTNEYYYSYNQSNYFNHMWGTNALCLTNAPKAWSNYYQGTFNGPADKGVKNRFGKPELPADVETIVQKFQQDRTRLMDQLKNCSDEERQQILQEMEQLRTQLRDQLSEFREQAKEQAEQMRNRFGNNRERMLSEGAQTQTQQRGGRDR